MLNAAVLALTILNTGEILLSYLTGVAKSENEVPWASLIIQMLMPLVQLIIAVIAVTSIVGFNIISVAGLLTTALHLWDWYKFPVYIDLDRKLYIILSSLIRHTSGM